MATVHGPRIDFTLVKGALWSLGSLVLVYSVSLGALVVFHVDTEGFMAAFLACVLLTYAVYRDVPLAFLAAGIITPIVWYLSLSGLVGT